MDNKNHQISVTIVNIINVRDVNEFVHLICDYSVHDVNKSVYLICDCEFKEAKIMRDSRYGSEKQQS